jgi:RHS repeat-associated protein
MEWDFKDQLRMVDLDGGGKAYYAYDSAGQRVRKVWEKSGLIEERIYLGGGYEVFRRRNGGVLKLERETLHVMDDKRSIAMVETKTVNEGTPVSSPAPLIRYQMDNHLGCACLELDSTGAIISYEEYYPYGSTSYQSVRSGVEVSAKRYRYTGKERDEETGLYYHVARHYAPWLGRWTNCDPAGLVDGVNLFAYAFNNPTKYRDPTGKMALLEDIGTGIQELTNRAVEKVTKVASHAEDSSATNPEPEIPTLLDVVEEQGGILAFTHPYDAALDSESGRGFFVDAPPIQPEVGDRLGPVGGAVIGLVGVGAVASLRTAIGFGVTAIVNPNDGPPVQPGVGDRLGPIGGEVVISIGIGIRPKIPAVVTEVRPVAAKAGEGARGLAGHEVELGTFAVVPNIEFRAASETEAAAMKTASEVKGEFAVINEGNPYSNNPPHPTTVGLETGPHVRTTAHTHWISGVAYPSADDIRTFANARFYGEATRHAVVGLKWPHATALSKALGLEPVPRSLIVGEITTAQARLAERAKELFTLTF